VVEMQAAEIRQLRKANAELQSKLADRKEAYRATKRRAAELQEREEERMRRKKRRMHEAAARPPPVVRPEVHSVDSSPPEHAVSDHPTSSPSPASSSSLTTSSPLVPLAQQPYGAVVTTGEEASAGAICGLMYEARKRMPFLMDYDIRSPLAVVNFSYPVCAFMTAGSVGYDEVSPTMVYANSAFCNLTGYSIEQLLGSPYHYTYVVNLNHYKQAIIVANNRPPFDASEVYNFHSLLRSSYGIFLRVTQNYQFFCNEHGKLRYSLLCIRDWEEGHLEDGEVPGQWPAPAQLVSAANGQIVMRSREHQLPPQLQLPIHHQMTQTTGRMGMFEDLHQGQRGSDAEMAAWLMDRPFPSESWPFP
jgi:PAS domain-containing protein